MSLKVASRKTLNSMCTSFTIIKKKKTVKTVPIANTSTFNESTSPNCFLLFLYFFFLVLLRKKIQFYYIIKYY